MDIITKTSLENIFSQDRDLQGQGYLYLLEATERPVDWAYEAWDELIGGLSHKDNHVRSIAAQLLCNLAGSDPENRMLSDFEQLLAVTKDERFVTARHCLQALWKIGLAGKPQNLILLSGLERRFRECLSEKNCTLIRFDILQGLRKLYDTNKDEEIRRLAQALIGLEDDLKYRKKYAGIWKKLN